MINLNRIPHIYHNTVKSRKLFEIVEKNYAIAEEIAYKIKNFNDLDQCQGYMLDLHGQNYFVLRNGMNDDRYRRILKFKMASIKFMGSPEEIKKLLALYFSLDESNISLSEGSGKIYLKVPEGTNIEEVEERIADIKGAGIGYVIDYDIYIEDFTVAELEEMTVEEIAKIKIARK